jgi:hypothetical protein
MRTTHEIFLGAINSLVRERTRQVHAEGFKQTRDDAYTDDELARAAAVYAMPDHVYQIVHLDAGQLWPWATRWLKRGDRRQDLVKAGALIIAEIERIDRLEEQKRGDQIERTRAALLAPSQFNTAKGDNHGTGG